MEIINKTICISYTELINGIITPASLKALVRRGKINQTRRGGNGRTALYEIESLPIDIQVELYRRYGNPYTINLGKIQPEAKDVAYYSCLILSNGKHLPKEYIEKYSYGCAILSRVIELHTATQCPWDKLADAITRLPAPLCDILPKSACRLRRKAYAYLKNGPSVLVSGRFCNSNASK